MVNRPNLQTGSRGRAKSGVLGTNFTPGRLTTPKKTHRIRVTSRNTLWQKWGEHGRDSTCPPQSSPWRRPLAPRFTSANFLVRRLISPSRGHYRLASSVRRRWSMFSALIRRCCCRRRWKRRWWSARSAEAVSGWLQCPPVVCRWLCSCAKQVRVGSALAPLCRI